MERRRNDARAGPRDGAHEARAHDGHAARRAGHDLFAALCSPNLRVAAQRIGQYKALIAPIRFGVTEARGTFTVELAWLDAPLSPPLSLVLMELVFGVQLARIGTREPVRPVVVTTTSLPSPVAPFEAFLGSRLRRGAQHAITFTGLQRRLEAEDTSFERVLAETREALARHYLERTALPIAEVSFLLGFYQPNSFYRAFRAWTGTTPVSVRRTPVRGRSGSSPRRPGRAG